MSYEGKHRLEKDGLGMGKVAGLAAGAATTAAILSVGFGAGTANADGGLLHNLFSPNKPSTQSVTPKKIVIGKPGSTPFGGIVVAPPTGDGSYFSFNGTGSVFKGICLNKKGC